MKNLILLFLVIGAAVSQVTLIAATTPALATPKWTLTYATPATGQVLSYTLALDTGSTAPLTYTTAGLTRNFGLACIITNSSHTVGSTIATGQPGFAFSWLGQDGAIQNNVEATRIKSALVLTYFPTMFMTSVTGMTTGGSGTVCTANTFNAAGTATVETTLNATTLVSSWIVTSPNTCNALPLNTLGWYAKCYSIADGAELFGLTTTKNIVATNPTDVTVVSTAAAAAACATTGALTFATGATILAGIAYLQF
jgi:hypothetical protein